MTIWLVATILIITLYLLIRYSHIFHPSRDVVAIAADDLLLVK